MSKRSYVLTDPLFAPREEARPAGGSREVPVQLVRQPQRHFGRGDLLEMPWPEVLDRLEVEGRAEAMTAPTVSTVVTRVSARGRRVPVIDWTAVAVVLVLPPLLVLVLRALGSLLIGGGR